METFYSTDQARNIRITYGIAIAVWIALVYFLRIETPCTLNIADIAILSLPIVFFSIAIFSVGSINLNIEEYMSRGNIFTAGLLVALPLLTWIRDNARDNSIMFTKIMAVGLILSLLSLFDLWVTPPLLPITKHLKSILQTMAIAIFVYGFYRFYIECVNFDASA